jgi:hypothetical protein
MLLIQQRWIPLDLWNWIIQFELDLRKGSSGRLLRRRCASSPTTTLSAPRPRSPATRRVHWPILPWCAWCRSTHGNFCLSVVTHTAPMCFVAASTRAATTARQRHPSSSAPALGPTSAWGSSRPRAPPAWFHTRQRHHPWSSSSMATHLTWSCGPWARRDARGHHPPRYASGGTPAVKTEGSVVASADDCCLSWLKLDSLDAYGLEWRWTGLDVRNY